MSSNFTVQTACCVICVICMWGFECGDGICFSVNLDVCLVHDVARAKLIARLKISTVVCSSVSIVPRLNCIWCRSSVYGVVVLYMVTGAVIALFGVL